MGNQEHLKIAFESLKQKILTSSSKTSDLKNRWTDNTVTFNNVTDRHIADILFFNFALSNEYLGALLTEINSYAELHTHILDNIEGMPFSQKNLSTKKTIQLSMQQVCSRISLFKNNMQLKTENSSLQNKLSKLNSNMHTYIFCSFCFGLFSAIFMTYIIFLCR